MKTAEDWIPILNDNGQSWTATVKAIQLDALRFAREFYNNLQFGQADDAILARVRELEGNK